MSIDILNLFRFHITISKCQLHALCCPAAIFQWCKAFYGYDNPEAERFMESYREILRALLNSRANECDEPDSYDDLRSYMETVDS